MKFPHLVAASAIVSIVMILRSFAAPPVANVQDIRATTVVLSTNNPVNYKKIHEMIGEILVSPQQVILFFGTLDSTDVSVIGLIDFLGALKSRSIQEAFAGRPQNALHLIGLIIDLTQKMANLDAPATVAESSMPGALFVPGAFAQQNAITIVKVGIEDIGRGLNGLPKPLNAKFVGTHHLIHLIGVRINMLQKQQASASKKAGAMTFIKKPSEYSVPERQSIQEFSAIVALEMSVLRSESAELRMQFAKDLAAATRTH